MANSCDINPSLSCLENQPSHLHVTAFFNRKGQVQTTNDYVSSSAVQAALGSMTSLLIIAWTITPRVVTARVKLTPQQLKLWANLDSLDFKEVRENFSGTHLVVSHYVTLRGSYRGVFGHSSRTEKIADQGYQNFIFPNHEKKSK